MSKSLPYFDDDAQAERAIKTILRDKLREFSDLEVIPSPRGEIVIRYMLQPARAVFTTIRLETKQE